MTFMARLLRGDTEGLAVLAAVALIGTPALVDAGPHQYSVDIARSRVDFAVRFLGFFSPGGHFSGVTGTVIFDPEHWETVEVTIRIPTGSLEARPAFWRAELLGPHFFDALPRLFRAARQSLADLRFQAEPGNESLTKSVFKT